MPAESPLEDLGSPLLEDGDDRVARCERLARWSARCLVASWVLAGTLVAVAAVTTRWPFIVLLGLVTVAALGSVVLAVLALRASPTHSWSLLLAVGVLNLVLLPNVAFVLGLLVSLAMHGFDLPT
jgi:hypothetical protein